MAKELRLTQGKVALVDDDDYERVRHLKWCAVLHKGYGQESFVARTSFKRADGTWTSTSLHRFIMGEPSGMEVDHRDQNTLNCQRSNLRIASRAENAQNRRKFKNNRSGYKGVYFCTQRGKYRACIVRNRTRYCLGYFETVEEAADAYNNAAIKLHGEFANLN